MEKARGGSVNSTARTQPSPPAALRRPSSSSRKLRTRKQPSEAAQPPTGSSTVPRRTRWPLFPGTSRFLPGNSPHGALLITYVNDTARTALTRRTGPFPPGPLPVGSIIVKENYTADRTLDAVTVMYKSTGYNPEHGDWYWLKRAANGNVDAEGRVVGCQNCHSAAARDYVLTEVQ